MVVEGCFSSRDRREGGQEMSRQRDMWKWWSQRRERDASGEGSDDRLEEDKEEGQKVQVALCGGSVR